MIDFDKMTVAEHEQYKEMQRKAEAFDAIKNIYKDSAGPVWFAANSGRVISKYEEGDQS